MHLPAPFTVISGARASIKSFTVTGKQRFDGLFAVVNTNVAADVLGTAKLCFAKLDNDGDALHTLVPFGISTGDITNFQYTDTGESVRFRNRGTPWFKGDMELRVD